MCYKLLIIILFIAPFSKASEDDNKVLELARETMTNAQYCALITVDSEGQPRARAVDPFVQDEEFVVWIATRPVTRKVEQIRRNNKVTLYYWHRESASYVTLMGTAELVDDVETKTRMRREVDSERFYPNFPDDYLLIKVTPDWLEALVPGYRGDAETWRPHGVTFDRQT
ncbi:MAG TPA: hypothetical protein DCM54_00255 [Gammaproteobacteria bacterium]|nr:hypothetical protein [Gammaproteobacteria bacterium]|tara:strand:- start:141 stop:650 length:510 start_codon:yes stop_codon:yes gene_type:complete